MNANNLNVCLCPMEIDWGNKNSNLSRLQELMSKMHPATDLLVLPETFSTGFPSGTDKEAVREIAERNTGETIDFIKSIAAAHNVAVAGTFIADTGGLLTNRAFFIEPSGDEYFQDKRHLFSMAGEDKVFYPGERRLGVRFRGWNISVVVCYDIRFPVWCRNVDNEYDLLIAVANWPEIRIGAWNKLLPARAIENQAYVCGVDCKGTDSNGIVYDGSSMAIDYKGNDITVRVSDDGLLYATLSGEKLRKFREKFPAWKDSDRFRLSE